jgi:hypothetical protein
MFTTHYFQRNAVKMDNLAGQGMAIFEQKAIRHIEHNGENYFSVVDIIEILSESPAPR